MSNLRSARFRRLYRAGSRPWIYYVSFLLSGAMLILLVQTAIYLANWPEDGVGWSASNNQVNWVDPAGPAAGILQPGDIIIRWDGVPIHQSTQTYTGKQPGDEIRFDVLRDGQISTKILRLLAPSAATMVNRLEPPLIALMFWVLGIVVFAFNTSNSMARLFYGIFSYASCGILAFGALSVTGLPWASRLFYSLMWLMGPLVVHLHLNFPSPVTIPYRQFVTRTLYACAAIAVLASLTFDLETIRSSQGFRLAIYLFLAANLLAAVALLVKNYQMTASTAARQQIRLVILGAALALVPFSGLALLPSALFGQPIISYNVAFLFLMAIPLAYGYGIIRYRLIQLDQHISRRFANVILTIMLISLYLILDKASHYLSALFPERTLAISVLYSLLVVTAFVPVRNKLQRLVDWAFYGGWYDYGTAVQKISRSLDQVTEPTALAAMLPRSLATTMKLECSCSILFDQDERSYWHIASCPLCPLSQVSDMRIDAASTISQHLQRERNPISGNLLRQMLADEPLSPDELQLLMCAHERIWVPLLGRETLLGILVLGSKQCDDVFDDKDFELLGVVARQASITIQNTSLLLKLRQRADDVERLHQELLRAREEERRRLARELHDEIIQTLVGLNYGLSKLAMQDNGQESNRHVLNLQQQLRQVMNDLRRICKELRPPALDSLGLVSALRSLSREIEAEANLSVELTVSEDKDIQLSKELEVCLFRILQEALTNIQKHARATHVSVSMTIDPSEVRLCVEDDGCGFPIPMKLSQFMDVGHFGLVGMRERLDLVGGQLRLASTPGRGTCLEAWISLPPLHNSLLAVRDDE